MDGDRQCCEIEFKSSLEFPFGCTWKCSMLSMSPIVTVFA